MIEKENFRSFPRQDILGRYFHFGVFEILFPGLKKDACRVDQPGLCFCTLGRKTLANMLIYIGDGILDSLKKRK